MPNKRKKHAEVSGEISCRIERFDDVEYDVLPLDRMTPLMGEPGSGKSILTLQNLIGAITRHGRSDAIYSAAI
jgi:KaiC/GvpD/RAD55 family RecA-like ATPase